MSREDHVGNLSDTSRTGVADADHDLGVRIVAERISGTSNDRPCLTDNLSTGRYLNGVRDDVHTRVEEDNFATSELHGVESVVGREL